MPTHTESNTYGAPESCTDASLEQRIQAVDRFIHGFRTQPLAQLFFRALRPLLISRTRTQPQVMPCIQQLRSMPTASLGWSLAQFLDARGLELVIFGSRRAQMHDCLHVLLGYDNDPIGELKLHGWFLAAKPIWINVLAAGYWMARSRSVRPLLEGIRRGQQTTLDPNHTRVEPLLHRSLKDVMADFGF